jgi:hypothetical protein
LGILKIIGAELYRGWWKLTPFLYYTPSGLIKTRLPVSLNLEIMMAGKGVWVPLISSIGLNEIFVGTGLFIV